MATRNNGRATAAKAQPLTSRTLSIEEFEQQAMAHLGQPPGYTIVLNDDAGSVHIPHPLLVADDRLAEIEAVQSGLDLDMEEIEDPETGRKVSIPCNPPTVDSEPAEPTQVRLARAVLGDAQHALLLKGGGKSAHVALAWEAMAAEVQATAPKRSR